MNYENNNDPISVPNPIIEINGPQPIEIEVPKPPTIEIPVALPDPILISEDDQHKEGEMLPLPENPSTLTQPSHSIEVKNPN